MPDGRRGGIMLRRLPTVINNMGRKPMRCGQCFLQTRTYGSERGCFLKQPALYSRINIAHCRIPAIPFIGMQGRQISKIGNPWNAQLTRQKSPNKKRRTRPIGSNYQIKSSFLKNTKVKLFYRPIPSEPDAVHKPGCKAQLRTHTFKLGENVFILCTNCRTGLCVVPDPEYVIMVQFYRKRTSTVGRQDVRIPTVFTKMLAQVAKTPCRNTIKRRVVVGNY